LVGGRPLAANTRATAAGSRALAPRPYTVSVGNATNFPAPSRAAASWTAAGSAAGRTRGAGLTGPSPPSSRRGEGWGVRVGFQPLRRCLTPAPHGRER
jgi:hypothetical protein